MEELLTHADLSARLANGDFGSGNTLTDYLLNWRVAYAAKAEGATVHKLEAGEVLYFTWDDGVTFMAMRFGPDWPNGGTLFDDITA
jgi:hypothetical protein